MITSVYHVGYGVQNDLKSVQFYQKYLNFGDLRVQIEDDSSGGFGDFVGRGERYRWSMMTHKNGSVDFEPVQLVSRKPVSIPAFRWGDIGINEVCFRVEGLGELFGWLKKEGVKIISTPKRVRLNEKWDKEFFYIEDPDGIRIKLEQNVHDAEKSPGVKDFDYLCVGVSSLDDSVKFYRDLLGYKRVIWEAEGHLEWMDDCAGEEVHGRTIMLGSDFDKYLYQLVESTGEQRPHIFEGKRWGDVGLLELCFRVSDLEEMCKYLSSRKVNVLVEPQPASPQLDYAFIAYVEDPDGNYIEFSQHIKKGD